MPRSPKDSNTQKVIKQKSHNRDASAATRLALALDLRAKKCTFEEIAHRCGYANPGSCRNAIQRELQRIMSEKVETLRQEEGYALDKLQAMCWKLAADKKNTARLFAVDRILTIMERRAKLFGLDTPVAKDDENKNIIVIRQVPSGLLPQPTVEATQ